VNERGREEEEGFGGPSQGNTVWGNVSFIRELSEERRGKRGF